MVMSAIMFLQIRSSDSIDSGFHSLSIGLRRSPYYPEPDLTSYTHMVRYRGGQRQPRQEVGGGRRTRSKSRDRARQKYSGSSTGSTPMISDYLNSPMFDVLHAKSPKDKSISLLSRPGAGNRKYNNLGYQRHQAHQPLSIISTCKVL